MTDTTIDTKFKLEGVECAVNQIREFSNAVKSVRLQDDGHLVARAMTIVSAGMTGTTVEGWLDVTDEHREKCMRTAKAVLAMVDDLQGQRLFEVTMPQPTDDAVVMLRDIPDPGPGSIQLRSFNDETGAFDVLNEHFRKQRT